MAGLVLVIDDKERLGAVVEEALNGIDAALQIVDKIPAAKQFLVQERPGVVISNVLLNGNDSAGFEFCREMRDHTAFADLPVILVGEALDEEVIRAATESGAHGLVGWPVAASTLRKRLEQFLNESAVRESVKDSSAPSAAKSAAAQAPLPPEATVEDKLKKAQHLLAMVLHSLKTSNLLEVVELEDVAGIVLQMTRSVCEGGGTPATNQPAAGTAKKQEEPSAEVEMDLDNVFGLKK